MARDATTQFWDDFNRWDCERCIYDYALLPADKKNDPRIMHRMGFCYLTTYQYNKAEPFIVKAITAKCTREGYLPSPSELYDRIRRLQGYAPPLYKTFSSGRTRFTLWARQTDWSRPIADDVPQYIQRATACFGADVQDLDIYIFDRRADFERFCKLLFTGQSPKFEQNGTGGNHVAIFCEEDSNGRMVSAANVQERRANLMHEVGHSLCSTNYGSGYLDHVPQWLDEGLADYIAATYYGDQEERYDSTLRFYQGKPAPTYEDMRKRLFEDTTIRYAVSGLMVQEILKRRDPSTVGKIIATARENGGDFDAAVKAVTGMSSQQAYTAVTSSRF